MSDWISLIVKLGEAVLSAALDGRKVIRIDEVLPREYADRIRLRALEKVAREKYGE